MSDTPSAERIRFAQRLRGMRGPRGYKTARSIAQKLGIHENRYTRYERAEVEPNLALLMQICEALDATPNDLLCDTIDGLGDTAAGGRTGVGFHEGETANASNDNSADYTFQTAAWQLASDLAEVIESRSSAQNVPPAQVLSATSRLYRRIVSQPFVVLSEIGDQIPLNTASLETQRRVSAAIASLVEAMRPSDV